MCIQLQVNDNKAISESQVGQKWVTSQSQVNHTCVDQNGYCNSKIVNTDWLIPLVG